MRSDSLLADYLDCRPIADCFAPQAIVRHMLAFEVALVGAQAELHLVPHAAAEMIRRVAASHEFDLAALRRETSETSSPAIGLVAQLRQAVAAIDETAAGFVHWGSTSQDVMDSATMLAYAEALDLLDGQIVSLNRLLTAMAQRHRATPMIARTLSQHAGPTSFGLKVAGWLNAIVAGQRRLRQYRLELPVQFGGASGNQFAYGEQPEALAARVAQRLGLREVVPWHTDRSTVRELAGILGDLAASGGKIATDMVALMQTEVAEIKEAPAPGRGGSSAMPHKTNPVASVGAIAGARRASGYLMTIFATFDHHHERASGAWHAESVAMSELFCTCGSIFERLHAACDGLQVNVGQMAGNLRLSGGEVHAEALVMALTKRLGRRAASDLVNAALSQARVEQRPFFELIASHLEVREALEKETLDQVLSGQAGINAAAALTDRILVGIQAFCRTSSDETVA